MTKCAPAAVRCAADARQALERLCRYITRPALANERVQTNAAGQVVFKHKTAWRDGTAHRGISPLEVMQRLAVLIDPAATAPANDRFGAVNIGCRTAGLSRLAKVAVVDTGRLIGYLTNDCCRA